MSKRNVNIRIKVNPDRREAERTESELARVGREALRESIARKTDGDEQEKDNGE